MEAGVYDNFVHILDLAVVGTNKALVYELSRETFNNYGVSERK